MSASCGYCFFAKDIGSCDILWCWKVKKHKDIVDPACACFMKAFKSSKRPEWNGDYCELVECDHYDWEYMSCEKLLTPERCSGCDRQGSLGMKQPNLI